MNINPIFSCLNHMYGEMSAYLVWAPVFNHSLATGSKFLVQEWAFMFLYPFILLSLQTECNCSMSFEEHVHDKSMKSSPLTQVCLFWNDRVKKKLCFIFSSTWHICKNCLVFNPCIRNSVVKGQSFNWKDEKLTFFFYSSKTRIHIEMVAINNALISKLWKPR